MIGVDLGTNMDWLSAKQRVTYVVRATYRLTLCHLDCYQ